MDDTPNETQPAPTPPWNTLTIREQGVAIMLGRGETNSEIAKALGISVKTVDTHRGHIMKKLLMRNNVKLALYLVREGKIIP